MPAPLEIFAPRILGEIYRAFRTGILTLKSGSITKAIYFDAGNMVFASSNLAEERLDERLMEWNSQGSGILRRVGDSSQPQLRLGQVLVDPGYVSEESLKD